MSETLPGSTGRAGVCRTAAAAITLTLDAETVGLLTELIRPRPFESLCDALRRHRDRRQASPESPAAASATSRTSPAPAAPPQAAPPGANTAHGPKPITRSPSPDPAPWCARIPELKAVPGLGNWRAVCDHLHIAVSGDSARRKLQEWVRIHRPTWPAVPNPAPRHPASSPSPVGAAAVGSPHPRSANTPMTRMTSVSHPLRIDELPAGAGTIGITFCPGKQDHKWNRDLGLDLDAIVAWGPSAMVTLIEEHEFAMLNVVGLGERVRARGIAWHHLPIVDVRPPDARFATRWPVVGPVLLDALRRGERVLVHCRGGLGRAGTVAALLLVGLGVAPPTAISRVRTARPGAIETDAQKRYVLGSPTPATPQ